MSTKYFSNKILNQKNTISISDSFTTIHSDTHFRNNKRCLTQFSSPLVSYHNISNKYLYRKFSENNNNIIDLENSNNFIRKDSLLDQKNNFSNSENESSEENESEDNFELSNYIYNKKNIINNNIDIDEYKQLKSNCNYYQTYQDFDSPNKQNTLKNNISYSPNNIISINYNNNNKEIILNQTPNQIMNLNIINQFNLVNNNNFQKPRFNSSNIIEGNLIFPIFNNNINVNNKDNNTEMFGRKGWFCLFCNNFNFESRNKCNKCKKNKSQIKNKKKIIIMIIIIIIFIKKITMKIKFKNNFLKEKVIGFVLIVKMLILLLGNFAIDVNYLKLSLKVYLKLTFKCLILILLVIIIKIKMY